MMTSPLKALGAALLLVLPVSAVAQPPKEKPRQSAPAPQKPAPAKFSPQYGQWNSSWGSRPPAPPKHWTKKSDWYRHVRACRQKYRSYDARTDSYRTSAGKTRRCPPG